MDIDLPGLRVHYVADGRRAAGEPVVLVHGFPQTSYEWRHVLPALADAGHPAFAFDTRGFGRTDKPRIRVDRTMLADDLTGFADALGLDRFSVVGHDWGGIIAFKAAIDHPGRVRRLALLDAPCTVMSPRIPHPYWYKVIPLPEAFFAAHARHFIEVRFGGRDAAVLGGPPGCPYVMPPGPRPRPTWIDDEALRHYLDCFDRDSQHAAIEYYRHAMPFHRVIADPRAPNGERYQPLSLGDVAAMWLHPDGFDAHPWSSEFLDFGPEDRAKRYENPALIVYSEHFASRFPSHADGRPPSGDPFAEQYARYLSDLRVRALPGGHYLPEEVPDRVAGELVRFLA